MNLQNPKKLENTPPCEVRILKTKKRIQRMTYQEWLQKILEHEPQLGAIETEIRNGTFEGDERHLKKRMHHLIGWFAADPNLRSRQYYDAVWCHLTTLMGN